jgi:hypothetical protein
MKTIFALAILVCSLHPAFGQAVQIEAPKQVQEKSTGNLLAAPVRAKSAIDPLEKKWAYSGFLVDLTSTNRPLHFLSLRKPSDPKKDAQNLSYDPMTGRAVGFRLFSIDF